MRFFLCSYENSIFRVLVTIEPGRSLLQFVTTNCLTPNVHGSLSFTPSLPIKSNNSEKICLISPKRGKTTAKSEETLMKWHHQIKRIREHYCRGFKLPTAKMWNLHFCQKKDHECMFTFFSLRCR